MTNDPCYRITPGMPICMDRALRSLSAPRRCGPAVLCITIASLTRMPTSPANQLTAGCTHSAQYSLSRDALLNMAFGPYSRCPVSTEPYSRIETIARYGPYRIIEDPSSPTSPSRFSIEQLNEDCTRWMYAAGPRTIKMAKFECLDWWEQRHPESFARSKWSGFFDEEPSSMGQPESTTARHRVPGASAHSRKARRERVGHPRADPSHSHSTAEPRPTLVIQLPPELCENRLSFAVARDLGDGKYQVLTGPRSETEANTWRQWIHDWERGIEVPSRPNWHRIAGTIVEASPQADPAMYASTLSDPR